MPLRKPHPRLRLIAAAIIACGASCVETPPREGPPPWSTESDVPIEIGGGAWAVFEIHEDGAPLYLERGFQGGQHIAYSFRARRLPPAGDAGTTEERAGSQWEEE